MKSFRLTSLILLNALAFTLVVGCASNDQEEVSEVPRKKRKKKTFVGETSDDIQDDTRKTTNRAVRDEAQDNVRKGLRRMFGH